jgi:hypothetical protein
LQKSGQSIIPKTGYCLESISKPGDGSGSVFPGKISKNLAYLTLKQSKSHFLRSSIALQQMIATESHCRKQSQDCREASSQITLKG